MNIQPQSKKNPWHQNVMDALMDKGVSKCVELGIVYEKENNNSIEVRQVGNDALLGVYRIEVVGPGE